MMRWRRSAALVTSSLALVVLGSGCGSAGHADASSSAHHAPRVLLKGLGVPAAAVAVIKGWADALRTGHPQLAAAYWALPSAMVNGTDTAGELAVVQIRTSRDALAADETLPCGATLQSTRRKGALVEAVFTLGTRVGSTSAAGCSGPAAVDFLIRERHIVRWLRATTGPSPSPGPGQSVPELQSVRAQPAPSGRSSNST